MLVLLWPCISENGNGVFARSETLNGVFGEGENGLGIHGQASNLAFGK